MKANYFLRITLAALLICKLSIQNAYAVDESYVQTIGGNNLANGATLETWDDKFQHLPLEYWNMIHTIAVDNIITFEINPDGNEYYHGQSFSCTLNFSIQYYKTRDQQTPDQVNNLSLTVSYNKDEGTNFPASVKYALKDAFRVIVTINSITSSELGTSLPPIFRLKNEILVKRKYPFSTSLTNAHFDANLSSSDNGEYNRLNVSWDPALFSNYSNGFGAPDEYDIEWSYIDELSERGRTLASMISNQALTDNIFNQWMRNDNTRITVVQPPYVTNFAYNSGYIVLRMRGAWYDPETGLRSTSNWVYQFADHYAYLQIEENHQPNLNWQYTAAYAEEGKHKEVITYFDGSLKSRQTVTVNTSDANEASGSYGTAVVAETMYDKMSRPTVSILPSPIAADKLKYYPATNNNPSNVPYSFSDITLPPVASCNIQVADLKNTSGASQYYSPNIPFVNTPFTNDPKFYFSKYVPDAFNKPFAVTQYKNDNTGRISKQGGVGPDFQIGSHDTKYYYAKPTQKQLDRLFGMEAGVASHYLKNMVIDPNGQVSVSYIDANGRTVATALSGEAPETMDAIPSNVEGATLNDVLISPSDMQADAATLKTEATATFVATTTGTFNLHYAINPSALTTQYGGTQQLCNNCYYSVLISVKDDCGVNLGETSTNAFQLNDASCYEDPQAFTGTMPIPVTKPGEYTVNYKLTLSEDVIKYQTDYYVANNTDLETLQKFFHKQLNEVDLTGCYSECSSCIENLGTQADFTTKMNALLNQLKQQKYPDLIFDVNTTEIQQWITTKYSQLLANCTLISANCSSSPCDEKLQQMKYDVSPGGQYLKYTEDPVSHLYSIPSEEYNVSILYFSNTSETNSTRLALDYKNDSRITNFEFTDEDGNVRHIKDVDVTPDMFIRAYLQHPEWADDFVKRHIEYCSYVWCRDHASASYAFDDKLRENVKDGEDAQAKGYFSRFNYKLMLDNNLDPFFQSSEGAPYKTQMANDLGDLSRIQHIIPRNTNGTEAGLPDKNILQLIDWLLYCQPQNPNATETEVANSWTCNPAMDCRSLTAEWELYRNYYLQLKSKYVQLAKQAAMPDCKNCFIGTDGLENACVSGGEPGPCPTASDFHYENVTIYDYSTSDTYNDYTDKSFEVYYVHNGGPVTRPVSITYTTFLLQLQTGGSPGPNCNGNTITQATYSTNTVTLQPGQDRIFLGVTIQYSHELLDQGCFQYYDPSYIYSVNPSSISCPSSTPPSGTVTCPTPAYVSDYMNEGHNANGLYPVQIIDATQTPFGATISIDFDARDYPNRFSVSDEYGNLIQSTSWLGYTTLSGPWGSSPTASHEIISFPKGNSNHYRISASTYWQGEEDLWSANITCIAAPPRTPSPSSFCSANPDYQYYQNKTRVFNDYVNIEGYQDCIYQNNPPNAQNSALYLAQAKAEMIKAVNDLQLAWKDKLMAVRDEEFAEYKETSLTEAIIDNLVIKLGSICKTYINSATDANGLRLVRSLPSPMETPDHYHNFEEVFTAIIGTTLMSKGFGPDLIEQPYPLDKAPVSIAANTFQLDNANAICNNITAIYNRFLLAGSGTTTHDFHVWLKQQLQEDYQLTEAGLEDIMARCSNGCRVLDKPLTLPAVFITSNQYKTCTDVSGYIASFATEYSQVTQDSKLYRVLLTNYLNLNLGYALSYYEYQDFVANCANDASAILYNKTASPQIPAPDDFACVAEVMARVYNDAEEEYNRYIEIIRREFRNSYISKCLSNNASLNVEGKQYEYHYTLYYYDQAGNLVKTIPPEGVRLLTDDQLNLIDELRTQEQAGVCPAGIAPNIQTAQEALSQMSTNLQSANPANGNGIEMWLYDANAASGAQVRIITADNKYFYQSAIYNGKLWVEMYSLTPASGGVEINLSAQAVADVSALTPLEKWTQLFVQSASTLTGGELELYLNGEKLTNLATNIPPYPFEWQIDAGSGSYSLPQNDLALLKQVRMYNVHATEEQIAANYKNLCIAPDGTLATYNNPLLFWASFTDNNAFCTNNGIVTTRSDALHIISNPYYNPPAPDYNMLTTVSNNFTVELWVKPQTMIGVDGELQSGVSGTLNQQYCIFPGWGGPEASNRAGMGISVGTNGVGVYEHADNYMPALLFWQGNLTGWTHIAVVYDNKTPKLYINGQLVKTGLQSLKGAVHPTSHFGGGSWGYMPGYIDEIRIWNYKRTAADIQNNMYKGILPAASAGLAGYWPINRTDGSIINDISCNNNDASYDSQAEEWTTNGIALEGFSSEEPTNERFIVPGHYLPTYYTYNSLNQVVKQNSPDGGTSQFWYDRLGRLSISQNAEQKEPTAGTGDPVNRFSYTRYDALGRITEVGEKLNAASVTEENIRNNNFLQNWLNTGSNKLSTITAYDEVPSWAPAEIAGLQHNLRKRVTAIALGLSAGQRPTASYYDYDISGNVKELFQENQLYITVSGQEKDESLKRIKYEYDLISGKVNKVLYQDGKWDQFYYQYIYDADNRLVKALSSRVNYSSDLNLWTTDATYQYYLHGPLARMEIGNNKVQGVDYAYTLQGWLKGVNGTKISLPTGPGNISYDMNQDGINVSENPFARSARDVFSFSLGYHNGDYSPVGQSAATAFNTLNYSTGAIGESGANLYNGNIRNATYAFTKVNDGVTTGYSYRYDQLNRLTGMNFHQLTSGTATWSNSNIIQAYKEQLSYDANGNIKTLLRNGNTDNTAMDDLTYKYYYYDAAGNKKEYDKNQPLPADVHHLTNQLAHVNDAVSNSSYTEDIESQPANNYTYDKTGNLLSDPSEHITHFYWNVYGKLIGYEKNEGGVLKQSFFGYDPAGNRVFKSYYQNFYIVYEDYYVRDAQGNVLAVYRLSPDDKLRWKEQHLYGSSRLGMLTPGQELTTQQNYTATNDLADNGILGKRIYELTNHLGNVMTTISDIKRGVNAGNGTIDHYIAEVLSQNDFYSGGMDMPGRTYSFSNQYRYGFNGKENDPEVAGQQDYGMRIYDRRLVRFKSVDPLAKEYPWNSTYAFAENDVIRCIDLDGAEKLPAMSQYKYNGSWGLFDWFKAVPNAAGRIYNGGVAGTWNSGVDFFTSLRRGTLSQDLKTEGKQIISNVKNEVVAAYDYHTSTPLKQQVKDFGSYLTNPERLEDALVIGANLYVGAKLGGKGNLLQTESRTAESIKVRARLTNSDAVNKLYTDKGYYAPYQSGVTLAEFEVPGNLKNIVRLTGANSKVEGSWFTTMEEIKGLSPAQLKQKFSLKYEPINMTPVTLTEGTTIRVGSASAVKEFGTNGGGFQIEVLNGAPQYGTTVPLKKP